MGGQAGESPAYPLPTVPMFSLPIAKALQTHLLGWRVGHMGRAEREPADIGCGSLTRSTQAGAAHGCLREARASPGQVSGVSGQGSAREWVAGVTAVMSQPRGQSITHPCQVSDSIVHGLGPKCHLRAGEC